MADTNFSTGTVVASTWLDDVNTNTYAILSAVAGTNTITATGASTVTVGYPRGVAFRFIPQNTNTGAVTINISGLGAKAVTKYGTTPLVAGDIVVGSWAYVAYDGTQFQLVNPLSVPTNVTGRLINVQRFTANGTYTPTAGTTRIIVEMVGGGGGGGGSPATGAGQYSFGCGGGSGAYSKAYFTSGFSGASVTVGTAGAAGILGGVGGTGGQSSFGALVTAPGGVGGGTSSAAANPITAGGVGGAPGTGGNIIQASGMSVGALINLFSSGACIGGNGASSLLGSGPTGPATATTAAGIAPTAGNYGVGGSGSATGASQGGAAGSVGAAGVVIVYEYS